MKRLLKRLEILREQMVDAGQRLDQHEMQKILRKVEKIKAKLPKPEKKPDQTCIK